MLPENAETSLRRGMRGVHGRSVWYKNYYVLTQNRVGTSSLKIV